MTHVDIVRRAYALLNQGDFDAVLQDIHPDIVWHTYIVPRPGGGVYRGHAGVRDLWSDAREIFGDFRNVPEKLFDAGDHVVSFVRVEGVGVKSGAAVGARIAHVVTFQEGKMIRIESFQDRDEALRAAGIDPPTQGTKTP